MPKADRHRSTGHHSTTTFPYPAATPYATVKQAGAKKMATKAQTNLADMALLAKIDKLFASGVGELIDLPQIIVVGDQSSGKSSVLEGLVSKAFPRDSGLCTRFATQLIFKRAVEESISVSIIPDSNADPEIRARLEAWQPTELASLDGDDFIRVMKEVHEVLGLSSADDKSSNKSTFSDCVLRLEIAGPHQEHLSVIDVPGIFKSTTAGLTTKADIALVRRMVSGYMENPRSVMLVVIPANVDVATQEIIEMAHDVDPEGGRTLGVLTKPDLVDKGAESRVLDMVNDRSWVMKLGWHIVRNPGQQELNTDSGCDRNRLEADFFRTTTPWNEVEKSKVAIEALRMKLTGVLSGLVKREFPKVKKDILKKLGLKQKMLNDLGPERSSSTSQLAHLIDLSVKFQQLMGHAIDGKFGGRDPFEESDLRLASLASKRMTSFSDDVARHGHLYAFGKVTISMSMGTHDDLLHERSENGVQTRAETYDGDLSDVLSAPEFIGGGTSTTILPWLKQLYEGGRGFELGTFEPSILAEVMKVQSQHWSSLSLGFTSDIIILVHKCITAALEHLTTDVDLRQTLLDSLHDGLVQRYRKAVDQTKFLNTIETSGHPFTVNHYFNENLQKLRQDRVTKHMKAVAKTMDQNVGPVIELNNAIRSHPMSNSDHTVQDIHDILFAYYKVARKRFVDNVVSQAAFYFLLNGPDNPLKLFSPSWVSRLKQEELAAIAGEAPRVTKARSQLQKEIASLNEARNILTKP